MKNLPSKTRLEQGITTSGEYIILAIISSAIDGKDIFQTIKKPIEPRHFIRNWEGDLWRILIRFREHGLMPDAGTLFQAISSVIDHYKDNQDIRSWFIFMLAQSHGVYTQNVDFHVEVLISEFHRFENNRIEAETMLIKDHGERRKLRDEMLRTLDRDIVMGHKQHYIAPEIATEMLDDMLARLDGSHKEKRLSWGYPEIDLKVPLDRKHFIVLAGRAGMGKTTMMVNLARAQKEAGYSVGIITIEMSRLEIAHLILSQVADVSSMKLKRPDEMTNEEIDRCVHGFELFAKRKIAIQETSGLNLRELEAAIISMKRDYPELHTIYIDHLHIMKEVYESRDIRFGIKQITSTIKILCKKHDVAICALAQLNREADKRESKEPVLSDLRESGSIEEDADVILMMYRADYYSTDSEESKSAEGGFKEFSRRQRSRGDQDEGKAPDTSTRLIVRKNRHGDANNFSIRFKINPVSKKMMVMG